MTASRTPAARAAAGRRPAGPGRRPGRALVTVLGLVALVAAAWFAVVGRRAMTAATPVGAGRSDGTTGDTPTGPDDTATGPDGTTDGLVDTPTGPDDVADGAEAGPDGSAVAELSRVSGLGRRSAEALVAGGVTTLAELAGRSDEELAAVLDAAGVQRSTTLATWPSQARRLLEV